MYQTMPMGMPVPSLYPPIGFNAPTLNAPTLTNSQTMPTLNRGIPYPVTNSYPVRANPVVPIPPQPQMQGQQLQAQQLQQMQQQRLGQQPQAPSTPQSISIAQQQQQQQMKLSQNQFMAPSLRKPESPPITTGMMGRSPTLSSMMSNTKATPYPVMNQPRTFPESRATGYPVVGTPKGYGGNVGSPMANTSNYPMTPNDSRVPYPVVSNHSNKVPYPVQAGAANGLARPSYSNTSTAGTANSAPPVTPVSQKTPQAKPQANQYSNWKEYPKSSRLHPKKSPLYHLAHDDPQPFIDTLNEKVTKALAVGDVNQFEQAKRQWAEDMRQQEIKAAVEYKHKKQMFDEMYFLRMRGLVAREGDVTARENVVKQQYERMMRDEEKLRNWQQRLQVEEELLNRRIADVTQWQAQVSRVAPSGGGGNKGPAPPPRRTPDKHVPQTAERILSNINEAETKFYASWRPSDNANASRTSSNIRF